MTHDRQDIEFPAGDTACAAWLYLPDSALPAPVVVMAHGLGGTREMRLDAFAERFRAAGYACLVFDYRYFGASGGEPRQVLDIGAQLADWASAVAYVRTRSDVDPTRIILWGTSFGGGHVISTAADDRHIAAVIAQCPFTDGFASGLSLNPLSALKMIVLGLGDTVGSRIGRAPVLALAAGSSGSAAMMTSPDAESGFRALVPEGTEHVEDRIAARFALYVTTHRPGRRTAELTCPVLFCVCEHDSVAPARATLRHARRAPLGEVRTYPDGHFDIYVGDAFERVVADQIEFLGRVVPTP